MTRGADQRTWLERLFARPIQEPLIEAEPTVPMEIQEWVEARVQSAAEQSHAAATAAREQQEIDLAVAIEEVAARVAAQIAGISVDLQASLAAAREDTEIRVQTATQQAVSQAEQGVAALGSALKGVAKVVASLKRDFDGAAASDRQAEAKAAIKALEADLLAIRDALENRIETAVSDHATLSSKIETAVSDHAVLSSKIANHDDQIAAVSEGVSSAVSDYNSQLRNVENRVEFVRQETMYELQASIMRIPGIKRGDNDQTIARIVNPEKVEKMRATGLRLNIGCGHIQHDDYLNVDARQLPGVDVVAQAVDLPFSAGEIQEIASAHLVEHFTSQVLDRVLLPYWKSLLEPGGQLTTVAPDGAAMLAAVNDGTMSFEDFREVLFGAQDYDGDFHYNLITPDSFRDALSRAGFVGIESVYTEKRNGKCFEFKTIARKP